MSWFSCIENFIASLLISITCRSQFRSMTCFVTYIIPQKHSYTWKSDKLFPPPTHTTSMWTCYGSSLHWPNIVANHFLSSDAFFTKATGFSKLPLSEGSHFWPHKTVSCNGNEHRCYVQQLYIKSLGLHSRLRTFGYWTVVSSRKWSNRCNNIL